MKADLTCRDARAELSARLDGELSGDAERVAAGHLAGCAACRAYEDELRRVARAVRMGVADEVPDLAAAILEQVERVGPGLRRADENRARLRIAAVAGAAAALLLLTASLPWVRQPSGVARAGEIVHAVVSAATGLNSYRATFAVTEHGWHARVPARRFSASVTYRAPEEFALQLRDLTSYPNPGRWPHNDVDLVANQRRSWIREATSCPAAALPGCPLSLGFEERSIVHRGPFDGTSALPTDIVVPLDTLASSGNFEVLGSDAVLGRAAYQIALPYRDAIPLIDALQAGGSWRPFHPLDRVEISIDRTTWFPLAYRVVAGASPDRPVWAQREGLARESPGRVLLNVRATSLRLNPPVEPSRFDAPAARITTDAGFREVAFERAAERTPRPTYTAGLEPYRAVRSRSGGTVLAYSDGMVWLKIASDDARARTAPAMAEEMRLHRSWAYYRPASELLERRVDVYGRAGHVAVESNLGRAELLRVARSLEIRGRRAPLVVEGADGATTTRIPSEARLASLAFAEVPRYLPEGYDFGVAFLSRHRDQRTLTTHYHDLDADYGGFGVRITQARGIDVLPPPAERAVDTLALRGGVARWTPGRGELEWIEDNSYRSVAVPSFDLQTAVRIAEGLESR